MSSKFNLEIDGKIKSTTLGNVDWYYGEGGIGYNSLADAKLYVPNSLRAGKTIGIIEEGKIVEYIWHPEDISDNGLVLKKPNISNDPNLNDPEFLATTVATNTLANRIEEITVRIADEDNIEQYEVDLTTEKIKFKDLNFNVANKEVSAENKQNKFNSTLNKIPKSISDNEFQDSRILDTGQKIGVGTAYDPVQDISLGNQEDREIGVEESDSYTRGRSLKIAGGKATVHRVNSVFNPLNTGNVFISVTAKSNGDLYALTPAGQIYKRDFNTTDFVLQNYNLTGVIKLKVSPDDRLLAIVNANSQTTDGVYIQNTNDSDFTFLRPRFLIRDGAIAPNGDIYTVAADGFTRYIHKFTNSTQTGTVIEATRNLVWSSITVAPNGDVYAVKFSTGWLFSDSNADIYKQANGLGDFVPYNTTIGNWAQIHASAVGDVYASTVDGDLHVQYVGTNVFVPLNQASGNWGSITSDGNNNVYSIKGAPGVQLTLTPEGDILFKSGSEQGAENLDGGHLRLAAGTGKGEGESRIEFITGQKQPSGTAVQPEVTRGYIDENGYFMYIFPTYSNNTDALAAGLPEHAIYKDSNGHLKTVIN